MKHHKIFLPLSETDVKSMELIVTNSTKSDIWTPSDGDCSGNAQHFYSFRTALATSAISSVNQFETSWQKQVSAKQTGRNLFLQNKTNWNPFNRPVQDYPGEPVPERYNESGFFWSKRQWVAMASAGPYASLHLAPDR